MSFSLERAIVGLGAGAAVAVQGLLEALWPSQAIRCALDKDFARAVTAAGVSGQPFDEWLADTEAVDSSPAAPPVGESSPAPNTSGCDTAPGEIPPSPGAIPTDGDCFDYCVGHSDATHQKSEGCWCGERINAEGSEESVLLACKNFRLYHAHRPN